jgi:hypothetical protein
MISAKPPIRVVKNGAGKRDESRSPGLDHDPEKWVPVFGKDHAPAIGWSGMTDQGEIIPLSFFQRVPDPL